VETINTTEALDLHSVPHDFDFLSVDTEGSEHEVLSALDFGKYTPGIICVEHAYRRGAKEAHKNLLRPRGYMPIFEHLSAGDTWFVRC